MDSWFREICVPRAWGVYLGTGFDFHGKNRPCFGSIRVPTQWLPSPTLSLHYEGRGTGTIFSETSCTY